MFLLQQECTWTLDQHTSASFPVKIIRAYWVSGKLYGALARRTMCNPHRRMASHEILAWDPGRKAQRRNQLHNEQTVKTWRGRGNGKSCRGEKRRLGIFSAPVLNTEACKWNYRSWDCGQGGFCKALNSFFLLSISALKVNKGVRVLGPDLNEKCWLIIQASSWSRVLMHLFISG